MASTFINYRYPLAGQTLTLYLRGDSAAADPLNGASGDTFTESVTETTGYYSATVTEALSGVYWFQVLLGSAIIDQGWVRIADDVGPYSLNDQQFPANFSSLGINSSGHVSRVTLVDTTTTNADMRGTNGANTTTPPSTAAIASQVRAELATELGRIDATVSSRLATAGYTAPNNAGITSILDDTANAIPALINGLHNPTTAQIFTAVLTTQLTESYAAAGSAPTLAQLLFMVHQHLCNAGIVDTTKTVYKLDGSTPAATFTLDDATTPTAIERTT